MSTFPSPIIDPHLLWRRRFRQLIRSQEAQNGIATSGKAEQASQVCSSLTSQSHASLTQSLLQLECALCMRAGKLWKLFCKNLACTGALLTAETTDLEHQMDRSPPIGKIMERATLSAVYPHRDGSTIGTCCARRRGTEGQCDLISNRHM